MDQTEWIEIQEMDQTKVERFQEFLDKESTRLRRLRDQYDQEECMQRARQTEIIKRIFTDLLNDRPKDEDMPRRCPTPVISLDVRCKS